MPEAITQLLQSCLAIAWGSAGAVLLTVRTNRSERDLARGMLGLGLLTGALATAFDSMTLAGGLPLGALALVACVALRAVAVQRLSPAGPGNVLAPLATFAGIWLVLHQLHLVAGPQPVTAWPGSLRPLDLCTGSALWFAALRTRWGHPGSDDEREVRQLLMGTGIASIVASVAGPHADRIAAGGALLAALPLCTGLLVDHLRQTTTALATALAAVLTLALRAHVHATNLDLRFAGVDDPLAALAALFVLFGVALQVGDSRTRTPGDSRSSAAATPEIAVTGSTAATAATAATGGGTSAHDLPRTRPDDSLLTTQEVMRTLRDPVTSMLAASRLIADQGPRSAQRLLQDMQEFGRQLATAMTDVDDLEHLLRGDIDLAVDVYDLPQLLTTCVDEVAEAGAHHAAELRFAPDSTLPRWIQGDPARVRQLVTRLLRLAVAESTIGPVTVTCEVHDERLSLRVQHHSHKGNDAQGIGLLFATRLAQVLGGELTSHFDDDRSVHCLSLPAIPAPDWEVDLLAQDQASLMAPTTTGYRLHGRVLLVSHSGDHQRLIGSLLGKAGADVSVADSADIALQLLAEMQFDLVVLDMELPGACAEPAVETLRARGDTTPVVGLIADGSPTAVERCLAAGCNDALRKPVDTGRLLQSLALHLAAAT